MKMSQIKIAVALMALLSLALGGCGGDDSKAKELCSSSGKLTSMMSEDLSELQELGIDLDDLFNQDKCETFFDNLSFCRDQLLDLGTAAMKCDPFQCEAIYNKYNNKCGDDTRCWDEFVACGQSSDCEDKFVACEDANDACWEGFDEEDDVCSDKIEQCLSQHSFQLLMYDALTCVEKNYSLPKSSVQKLCDNHAADCGFTSTECQDYIKDTVASEMTTTELDAIASLADCVLNDVSFLCSDVVKDLIPYVNENGVLDWGNLNPIEFIEKYKSLIKNNVSAVYHCSDEIVGIVSMEMAF
ncbi:MAG: hypothetical protein LBM75_09945 [Myxococcales bacterium]|nr:hypothetical protein [Myxococcales bacterium]